VRTIGPPADCDVCGVIKGEGFELRTLITLFALEAKRSDACHLIVTLQARGREADSNVVRMKIDWDGKWADGAEEMTQHMKVRVISE
jgi:hypothetical protein